MFNGLINLFEQGKTARGVGIIISMLIILGLMIWITIDDVKKMKIKFWKILVATSSTILCPLVMSLFCGCKYLKFFLLGSILIWFLFLLINIKFNNSKIIGKADIDIMSAIISENLMCTLWLLYVEPQYASIKITALWYNTFLYLMLGSIIFMIIVILILIVLRVFFKKKYAVLYVLRKKLPVIPLLIPMAVMAPYFIMVM